MKHIIIQNIVFITTRDDGGGKPGTSTAKPKPKAKGNRKQQVSALVDDDNADDADQNAGLT